MNMKRILLVVIILMIVTSSVSIVSAGWFDNYIEGATFKFEVPEGYSGDTLGTGVLLTYNDDNTNVIQVNEIDKDNYTSFKDSDSGASFVETSVNGESADDSNELLKEVNEDNLKIVVQKNTIMKMGFTNAVMQKDGSYYSVSIAHTYDTNLINTDIQNIKDIYDSLEKL